jgi:hypothetical protein
MEIQFTFPGMRDLLESMTLNIPQACLIEAVWKRDPNLLIVAQPTQLAPHALKGACEKAGIPFHILPYSGIIFHDEKLHKKQPPGAKMAWLLGPGDPNMLFRHLKDVSGDEESRSKMDGFLSNYRYVFMLSDLGVFSRFSLMTEKVNPKTPFLPWTDIMVQNGAARLDALPDPIFEQITPADAIPIYQMDPRLEQPRLMMAIARILTDPMNIEGESLRLIERLEENSRQGLSYEHTMGQLYPRGHWIGLLLALNGVLPYRVLTRILARLPAEEKNLAAWFKFAWFAAQAGAPPPSSVETKGLFAPLLESYVSKHRKEGDDLETAEVRAMSDEMAGVTGMQSQRYIHTLKLEGRL